MLIAYNWAKDSDQYKKIRKFVGAFFPQIAKLQAPPHHPKWREVNLAATLPGWPRFAAAETWLAQHKDNAPVRARARNSTSSCARAAERPDPPRITRSCFRNFCNGARRARAADGTRDGGSMGGGAKARASVKWRVS